MDELREIIKQVVKSLKGDGDKKPRILGKFVGKPTPWDGESEAEFKSWSEKFTMFMSTIFDKNWKTVTRKLHKCEDQ